MKIKKIKKIETIDFSVAKERLIFNLIEISNLIKFEKSIIDIAKSALSEVRRKLKRHGLLDPDMDTVFSDAHRKISIIYRDNKNDGDEMPFFKPLLNQSLVSIISNLESFLKELFILFVNTHYESLNVESSISWKELKNLKFNAGEILLATYKGNDFQDLKATLRVFEDNLGIPIGKIITSTEHDDLILAYAIRHIIVHKNAKIDEKFLSQIRNTRHAGDFELGEEINLTVDLLKDFADVAEKFSNGMFKKVEFEFINRYNMMIFGNDEN